MSFSSSRISIGGMHCAACSARIERVIGGMPGVDGVEVSLPAAEMRVRFDPQAIALNEILTRVRALGFEAEPPTSAAQTSFRIGGMHCAACSARIERLASRMEGMREAAVNLGTG